MLCVVCNRDNDVTALFCTSCTSPLSVRPLGDFGAEERQQCLTALWDVLAAHAGGAPADTPTDSLWLRYLSTFWLRPETALVCYAEARAVARLRGKGPWLDLGCGDGIHAALYSGWKPAPDFDAFQGLDLAAADVFDHWDADRVRIDFEEKGEPLDHGIDVKETAIARASALGVFREVALADATALPLEDASIGTIFSNMLRDLDETLDDALAECRRVLRPDGVLLLSTMTPRYADSLYFAPAARRAADEGDTDRARALLDLDRGRSVFCRQQLTLGEWNDRLARHGLGVERSVPTMGPRAIRFWDVGLRPFSPALIAQAEVWREQGVLDRVKPPLVAAMAQILAPLPRDEVSSEDACMQMLRVVRRRV